MESPVDLDQVAGLISRHAIAWEQAGLVVGALSWRDVAGPWPYPLREDRNQVAELIQWASWSARMSRKGNSSSSAADGLTLSTGAAVPPTSW